MTSEKPYIIPIDALHNGTNEFEFSLFDDFFESMEGNQILGGEMDVKLRIVKTGEALNAEIEQEGFVVVQCDRCLGEMDIDIELTDSFSIRFGDSSNDSDDEIFIDPQAIVWDCSWRIYENALLEVPMCHSHAIEDCDANIIAIIEQQNSAPQQQNGQQEIDPRWNALKDIY